MRIWTRREHWMVQAIVALAGLGLVFFEASWTGLGFQRLPPPLIRIIEAAGVAVFLAGTVSFGMEELLRGRTLVTFEQKMGELLSATGVKLTSQITSFMEAYVGTLGERIEQLGKEIHGSNIAMIYSSRAHGLEAMGHAITEANDFVYVMGISLREFFQLDTPCSRALAELYHANRSKRVNFRVLILNNRSSEALDRSAREEGITFTSVEDPEYKGATLFFETRKTIANIKQYFPDMALRVYDSQSLFLLITERALFMEPYHYGERVIEEFPFKSPQLKRVAELVPLIEFERSARRGPYEQFLGHFEYLFAKAQEPGPDNLRV